MRVLVLLLVVLSACLQPVSMSDAAVEFDAGQQVTTDASVDASVDAGPVDSGIDIATLAPSRWPAETSLTHDLDTDLNAVLEASNLQGACARYEAGATDELTKLRCGKSMFFDGTFGTVGVPKHLLEFLQKYYADSYYGPGFTNFGFIADPRSTTGMPIGLAPSTGKLGNIETTAFTCAACHFAKLPDGRYSVGAANLNLRYGGFVASMGAPISLSTNANDPKVTEQLRMELAAPVAAAKMRSGYTVEMGLLGLELLGAGSAGQLSVAEQDRFLKLQNGTLDFLTKPLIDDGVWTVSRMISLWNLPNETQRAKAGMPHELLSFNAGVPTLSLFLQGFVVIGAGANEWPPSRLAPLEAYVRTLRAPVAFGDGLTAAQIRQGATLFVEKGCLTCHSGPSGEGSRVFGFDEVATDTEYAKIYNAAPDAGPCCGLGGDASYVTRGVKAPRMSGSFSQTKFFHNGSIDTLEQVFCLEQRPTVNIVAQTAQGHLMTCLDLTPDEKRALITWLKTL